MQVHRVNVATKLPRRHAASDQVRDGFHHTRIARPEGLQLSDMLRTMNVFDGDEAGRKGRADANARLAKRLYVRVIELGEAQQPEHVPPDDLRYMLPFPDGRVA